MKRTCPVCGKAFWCDYPDLWVFKRNGQFICSYSCTRAYDRKEASEMYSKTKKDGSPARKPGPKKAEGNMTVVATKIPPEAHEEENKPIKAIMNPLEVYSVKSRVVKANYRYDDGNLILEGPAFSFNMLLMTGKEWVQFADEIRTAIEQLGVET